MSHFSKTVKRLIDIRSDGYCEVCDMAVLVTYHHRRPRGAGGSTLPWVNQAANGLAVCNDCHLWAEGRATGSSRERSYEVGWLISMHGTRIAEQVPVMRRGRKVLLTDAGDVVYVERGAA